MGLNILAWVKAKKYTDNAVSQTSGLHREIVNSLPITGDDKVIYMVPITGSGDDNYNEYMWINGAYELIGNTRVDLTDYYNKTQVDTALNGKANVATSLAGYGITDAYTKTEVDTALSDFIILTEKWFDTPSVGAGQTKSMTISFENTTQYKNGYRIIGIAGIVLGNIDNHLLSAFDVSGMLVSKKGAEVYLGFYNSTSSAIQISDCYITVIMAKTA